ncbi:MAG TPA: hypothetical protein VFS10_09550 [Pyrinomonadaceae bacterium]|nr:hypothetical protein [Pyrinomonadaceae bacterium]
MRNRSLTSIVSLSAAVLFVACALAAPALAQDEEVAPESRLAEARKVSEYVNLFSSCNAGAHLDNFAIELEKDEQAVGYVVGYTPGGKDGKYGRRLLAVTKNYLVNSRGIVESRIKIVSGGRYKNSLEAATELWVVPQGAEPPPLVEYADKPQTFEGKFADYVGWDGYDYGDAMSWSSADEVALAAFADHLRHQPKSVAYLVGYTFPASAVGTWRRVLNREVRALEAEGIESARIKTIFGGKGKAGKEESGGEGVAQVQLWLLPADALPPVREARRERRPKEAQRLGVVPGYVFDPDTERRALEGLADVLREDESLRGFLIVRLPSGERSEMTAGEESERAVPEVDAGAGERWKKQLAEKYGVNVNRIVILLVPPGEGAPLYGELEAWVVPPGAAPPDPFAEADEEETEEAGEASPKEF